MSILTSTRIFIILSLCLATQNSSLLSGDNQHSGNELGVDQCSHKHFLIVDKFFVDSIWRHIEAPQHHYKFVQCSREAHVGSKYREYMFAVEIGEVECNFTFKVHDVNTEKTLEEFNPLEINDLNKCKEAIHIRYPVIEKEQALINEIKADDIETSGLHPLFSDIADDSETSGLRPLFSDIADDNETSGLHPLFSDIADDNETSGLHPLFSDIPDDNETSDLQPLFHDIPEVNGDDEEIKEMFKNGLSFKTGPKKVENEPDYDLSDTFDESKHTWTGPKKVENQPDYHLNELFDESNVDWTGPHREVADIDNEEQDSKLVEQKRFNRLNAQAPAQKTTLLSTEEPELKPQRMMVGGYRTCDLELLKTIPTLFTILANQNVLKGFKLYLENITDCKSQVVNGVNYKITTSINEEVCSYVIYKSTKNEVNISSHQSDVAACRAYLTQKFASQNPALV
jgi:Cystatin domain